MMKSVNKKAVPLLFIISLASCLIVVKPSSASEIVPQPSVPEFTIRFVNASYSVTTTNPFTGVYETRQIRNNSIEIKIRNQPFTYSNDYRVYFNVRTKPHFEGNWTEIYRLENLTSSHNADGFSFAEYVSHDSPNQSNQIYTNITFPVIPTDVYQASGYDIQRYYTQEGEGRYFAFLYGIPYEGQVDFQVEALVGHNSTYWYIQHPFFPQYGGYNDSAIAYDSTSGWSNTQTITIGGNTSATIPQHTPSTENTTNAWETWQSELVIGIIIVVALTVGISLVYLKKHKERKHSINVSYSKHLQLEP